MNKKEGGIPLNFKNLGSIQNKAVTSPSWLTSLKMQLATPSTLGLLDQSGGAGEAAAWTLARWMRPWPPYSLGKNSPPCGTQCHSARKAWLFSRTLVRNPSGVSRQTVGSTGGTQPGYLKWTLCHCRKFKVVTTCIFLFFCSIFPPLLPIFSHHGHVEDLEVF